MTDYRNEILKLWLDSDISDRELIKNVLICTARCGSSFQKDMNSYLERDDRDGALRSLQEWLEVAETM